MRVAIITTDNAASTGDIPDAAGEAVRAFLKRKGVFLAGYAVMASDRTAVASEICRLTDHYRADLILTVGGTGLSSSDIIPDVTYDVIEMEVPGIGEALRMALSQDWPGAMLSRATAGVRQQTLIINLVGEEEMIERQLGLMWEVLPGAIGELKGRGLLGRVDVK